MSLVATLHTAHQIMRRTVTEACGHNITPSQALVLAALAENEGVSQTVLTAKTGIDRSTLADLVRRLLKSGHLTRRRVREDARRYAVTLTPLGRDTAQRFGKAEGKIAAALRAQIKGVDKLAILPIAAE